MVFYIFIIYMNNNLLNETFNKHLNLLRNRLKLNESENEFISERYRKISEYARELLAKKPFYYQNPDGRYQLIDKIKSYFKNFHHNLDVHHFSNKELMTILNDVLSDDEQWVTAKDTRETDYVSSYPTSKISSMKSKMPAGPEKFAEFPVNYDRALENPVE